MKAYIAFFACALFSTSSFAGVEETKATRALTDDVGKAVAEIKNTCANANLEQSVQVDEKFTAQQIKIAQQNVSDFVKGILKVCEDADYKAEISKIEKINFSLTDSGDKTGGKTKISGEIKASGGTMDVALHTKNSLSNGSSETVVKAIKELY